MRVYLSAAVLMGFLAGLWIGLSIGLNEKPLMSHATWITLAVLLLVFLVGIALFVRSMRG